MPPGSYGFLSLLVFQRLLIQDFTFSLQGRYLYPVHTAGALFHILTSVCLHVHTFACFVYFLIYEHRGDGFVSDWGWNKAIFPIETTRWKCYRSATISISAHVELEAFAFSWLVVVLSFARYHPILGPSPNFWINVPYTLYSSLTNERTVKSLHFCTALWWGKDQTQLLEAKNIEYPHNRVLTRYPRLALFSTSLQSIKGCV